MAIIAYGKQDEYDVVNESQDCRGWAVVDQAGNQVGTVSEMLVNTDTEMVDSIIVDGGVRIPARSIALRDGRVIVSGVLHGEEYEQTRRSMTQTAGGGSVNQDYTALEDQAEASHVSGVTRAANDNEVVLPIVEEQLRIGKRTVESGAARVHTSVTEKPIEKTVNLREEHVTVERHPVDRAVGSAPEAFREGTIEITERAEVPVVEKEARVVEEVVIGKETTERQETVRDTIKRTEVDVDEVDTDNRTTRGDR